MKHAKILSLLLAILTLLTFVSCSTNSSDDSSDKEKRIALDFTAEWEKIESTGSLVQGCLIVSENFVKNHPAELNKFLEEYASSVDFVNTNIDEAAEIIATLGILPKAAIAKKAIPGSNLVSVTGEEMKSALKTFYNILFEADSSSILALPDDDFYYIPGSESEIDKNTQVKITALSGTTGMGLAPLMERADRGETSLDYEFEIVGTMTDAVVSSIISGQTDIAAVPTNLAPKLYKRSQGNIKVIAINTLGVLYLLENGNSVSSVADLSGKTVYVPGIGANPEYITKHIIEKNGITDVNVDCTTYTSPDELASAFSAGLIDLAVLPEPKVTAIMIK